MRRLILLLCLVVPGVAQTIEVRGGTTLISGEVPRLFITAKPEEKVLVESYRVTSSFQPGTYDSVKCLAHAYATFVADKQGRIDLDTAVPLGGTYAGADPLGLLWSGERVEWAETGVKPGEVLIKAGTASLTLTLTSGRDRVELTDVNEKGLNGAFAKPKGAAKTLPAILLLHGSEGGSQEDARASAVRFAQLGYAAFAVNYFSWAGLGDIPKALVNIPVETLTRARDWLGTQPGVSMDHMAIWGVSKGAEFALVAAAYLPWVERVVACVPSSVVWSGFGRAPAEGEVLSSWQFQGKSLPYVPYENYDQVLQYKLSAGAEHALSLSKATEQQRAAARIPVEKSNARILLLGATRDHVWPSGQMIPEIEKAMRAAGKADQLKAFVFPDASHFICGTGAELQRIQLVLNPEGHNPSPDATARAGAKAWAETKAFLAVQ